MAREAFLPVKDEEPFCLRYIFSLHLLLFFAYHGQRQKHYFFPKKKAFQIRWIDFDTLATMSSKINLVERLLSVLAKHFFGDGMAASVCNEIKAYCPLTRVAIAGPMCDDK